MRLSLYSVKIKLFILKISDTIKKGAIEAAHGEASFIKCVTLKVNSPTQYKKEESRDSSFFLKVYYLYSQMMLTLAFSSS